MIAKILALMGLLPLLAVSGESPKDTSFQRLGGVPVVAFAEETGFQLGVLGMVFFRPTGEDDPGSQVDVAAIWTTKGQKRFVLSPTVAFLGGKIRWESEYQYKDWPGKYWSGGNNPTDSALSYDMRMWLANGSVLWLVHKGIRLGAEYDLENNRAQFLPVDSAGFAADPSAYPSAPASKIGGNRVGMGWSVQWDHRDHDNWPRNGTYAWARQLYFNEAWGSDWNFILTKVDLRGFVPTPLGGAGAFGAYWEGLMGDVPFDRLSMPDGTYHLRGLEKGRLKDRQQLVLQGEWRVPLFWRFSAASFVEAGKVGPYFGQLMENKFHYAFGLGGRFALNPSRKLNVRGDLAWVDGGIGLTIYYKEAF